MNLKYLNRLMFAAILCACAGRPTSEARFRFPQSRALEADASDAISPTRPVPRTSGTSGTSEIAGTGETRPFASVEASPHVAFGLPRDRDPGDELLLDRGEFVVSYSKIHNGPNWVAWRLTRADLGRVKRKNHFHADLGLPYGLLRVEPEDFGRSGYDRGHLCPSADRTATEAANETTFLMTNMHPQLHALNGGPWEELEEYSRMLLYRKIEAVYLVAGALYSSVGHRIGRGVSVPTASYKVLLAPRSGAASAAPPIYESVIMPNEPHTEGTHWQMYRTSVAEVETASGYDFWSRVVEDPKVRPEHVRTPAAF